MSTSKKTTPLRKTKEELLKEIEQKKEVDRQRKFAKDTFYKFLLENTKTIAEAKDLCGMANMYIEQVFSKKVTEHQRKLSNEKLSFLQLGKEAIDTKTYAKFKKLFELFNEETIATASSLIKGMETAINGFEREEITKRPLSSLKTTFL